MPELAWVNGEITDLYDAKVPFMDHGYLFGYGVYEALKVYNGKPFCVEEHMDRFERSMKEIRIKPELSREEIIKIIYDLVAKSEFQDAFIYLQLTRGVGPRNNPSLPKAKPTLSMFVAYLPPIPDSFRQNGVKAVIVKDDRWAHPHIKSLNLLPNILAKQIAEENDAYEAILAEENGTVTEGASSNVYAVFKDTIVTRPTDGKILSGITRLVLCKIIEQNGFKYREDYFTTDELKEADEVFITNSGAEVLAVTEIEGKKVGNGLCGPITQKLYNLFMEEVKECVQKK